ncbi:DNA replication protein [uncultured Clostridium sp.]|uniref:DNA replication protein n=1 Tax=uncultured Clostridium sp. TaxID=59620 RepID=UPI0025F179E7|nr:DNA replication protein [uncultured Clostridium sp.]
MADRRMISRTILDSDKFLDMPLTTQALYIHLISNADDDGFLNNSQKIIRMIGAARKDFELLISSDFLIMFENGICVIKHWKLHNYIRADRYKPTVYKDEFKMLTVTENKMYKILNDDLKDIRFKDDEIKYKDMTEECGDKDCCNYGDTFRNVQDFMAAGRESQACGCAGTDVVDAIGIPDESILETQNKLDKVSIDKNNIDKDKLKERNSEKYDDCVLKTDMSILDTVDIMDESKHEIEEKHSVNYGTGTVDIMDKNKLLECEKYELEKHESEKIIEDKECEYLEHGNVKKLQHGEAENSGECDLNEIIEKWNHLGISNITCIKNNRRKMLKARINEHGSRNVMKAIGNIEKSSFLKGQNDRGWAITFDWFIKPNNFIKVFEGNYSDKCGSNSFSFNNFKPREYDYDDLEKKLLGWA